MLSIVYCLISALDKVQSLLVGFVHRALVRAWDEANGHDNGWPNGRE